MATARVSRLSGAILLQSGEERFLVGNPKEPCALVDGNLDPPYVKRLEAPVEARPPFLLLGDSGGSAEALARTVAARFVIERNGSVSERLWRLAMSSAPSAREVEARWLAELPEAVWQVVRDAVLKCT